MQSSSIKELAKKYLAEAFAQSKLTHNVLIKVTDRHGNVKKQFQPNLLGRIILDVIRKFVCNPIQDCQVRPGLLNHLAAYGLRVPGLTGRWVSEVLVRNLVVSAGKAGAASRLNGAGGEALFGSIGMGTGTTAPAAGDTALQNEVNAGGSSSTTHVIGSATATRVTTSVTNDTAQLVGTVNVTATIAVTESGVFNATTAGTMLCRQTFSAINVVNGDSIQFTWRIQVS